MNQLVQEKSLEVTVTEAAQKFMKRMVRFGGQGPSAGFWMRVSSGGCSGLSATFEVHGSPGPEDTVVELPDLRVFVGPESARLLEGVTIDFADTRTESGLKFVVPNAEDCSCSSGKKGVQLGVL